MVQIGKHILNNLGKKVCISCGKNADSFSDNLSEKEYNISGLCQICQDSVFGENK